MGHDKQRRRRKEVRSTGRRADTPAPKAKIQGQDRGSKQHGKAGHKKGTKQRKQQEPSTSTHWKGGGGQSMAQGNDTAGGGRGVGPQATSGHNGAKG